MLVTQMFYAFQFAFAAAAVNTSPATVGDLNTTGLVAPINNTNSIPSSFSLSINDSHTAVTISADVAAMTAVTGTSFTTVNGVRSICSGSLVVMPQANTPMGSGNVVMMSCDDPVQTAQMLTLVANANPACTVMYSLQSQGCNFTSMASAQSQLGTMFTSLTSSAALSMISRIGTSNNHTITAIVGPNSSSNGQTGDHGSHHSNISSTIAMAVLYSATGIIATAFLFVIISGAIRVHKHPERYGLNSPTGGDPDSGRHDDSTATRAKGLARAVLDSIPLVTFQLQQRAVPDDQDIELGKPKPSPSKLEKEMHAPNAGNATSDDRDDIKSSRNDSNDDRDHGNECHHGANGDDPEGKHGNGLNSGGGDGEKVSQDLGESDSLVKESLSGGDGSGQEPGPLEACPICFESFEDGDVLRVLPCRHQFHAICVDPWLLNSSSQCPLCRVDLSLQEDVQVSEDPPNIVRDSHGNIIIPPGYDVNTSLFNRFLDVWNAQLLPRESRRAVLARFQHEAELRRQIRQQRLRQGRQNRGTDEEAANRSRWIRFVNSRRALFQRNQAPSNSMTAADLNEPHEIVP